MPKVEGEWHGQEAHCLPVHPLDLSVIRFAECSGELGAGEKKHNSSSLRFSTRDHVCLSSEAWRFNVSSQWREKSTTSVHLEPIHYLRPLPDAGRILLPQTLNVPLLRLPGLGAFR